MWGNKRREAEQQRDAAIDERDAAVRRAERAEAKAAELSHKYEQPVTVRHEIPTGFESNRRRH